VTRTRVNLGGGLLAFGAALACCDAAMAQMSPGAPTAPTALAGAGSDRFMLEAHARASYDSNVAGGDELIAALRRLKQEDTIYTLGATATFRLPSTKRSLFLTAAADFDRHQENRELDADNYIVTAGGNTTVGPCGLSGLASYSHRLALIQDLTVPVAKNIVDQEDINAGVTCGRRGMFAGLNGGYSKLMNDAKTSTFIDSSTRNVAASVGYQNKNLGSLSLVGTYSKIEYDDPPGGRPVASSSVDQSGIGVNYSRKIGNRLSGNAGVNYTWIDPKGFGDSSSAFGANIDLDYRASPRLNLSLDYTLSNNASTAADASYVRTGAFRFGGDYRLNSRVSLQASVAKSREDYRGGLALPILQLRKSDDWIIAGGGSVRIGRKVSLTFDASHTDRKADLPQFNYKADRVSVGITGTF
jgi:hypothetical protein